MAVSTIVGNPIPPKPSSFTPFDAPPGIDVDFSALRGRGDDWWKSRPAIDPRNVTLHTQAGSGRGNSNGLIGWANAGEYSNTHPHYGLNTDRSVKLVPSDRRGIGNSTESWYERQQGEVDASYFSIVVETEDGGSRNAPYVDGGEYALNPGRLEIDLGPLAPDLAEDYARIMAFEAIVHDLPLIVAPEWNAKGMLTHTWPFPWPAHTTQEGKNCPTPSKKRQFVEELLPRAIEIHAAWTGIRPPEPPPKDDEIMIFMKHPNDPHLFVADVRHVDAATRDQLIALGVTERVDDMTDAQLAAFKRITDRA